VVQDQFAGSPGRCGDLGAVGRGDRPARLGKAESLRYHLRGQRRAHERASTAGWHGGVHPGAILLGGQLTAAQGRRERSDLVDGRVVPPGGHRAAGHVHRRQVQPGGRHQMCRYGLVAAGDEYDGVIVPAQCMHLADGRDEVPGQQAVVHAVGALGDSVAHVGAHVPGRSATGGGHPGHRRLGQAHQMYRTGVTVPGDGLDEHMRAREFGVGPAHAAAQRIAFRPGHPRCLAAQSVHSSKLSGTDLHMPDTCTRASENI
jgi:hypothetical protein